jgi:serine/threonine protein kinase
MTEPMTSNRAKVEELFEAVRTRSAEERARYLADACGPDTELRAAVESLLTAHDAAAQFLQSPAVGVDLDPPLMFAAPGTMIGRYKLLEPIGEGGYGVVFMAEQTAPVQRRVALKIIKAGMDTKQVIARFEAERQALALMDHPNIAKVFDAGVTDTGRPYFVMELVKGVSIIKYCDAHHVPPRERLELFVQVCQAVQHAHQKGIIHRDIKPTNVLIALYDGKPVPKVIDFGVAKATGQQLTERTMFTGFGDVIGTLEYMSPEQAEMNQLDVDTRSDIYSLGVLLYELLTGSTPLENKRIKQVALLEVLKFIREEEPPRPSTRLSTAAQLPHIAANRGVEPKKLSGLVKGELDWIVMKSLEKDRSRRYETANGLALDVQRYLEDETVHACPPSSAYRFKKFVRRHKVGVLAGSAVVSALMVGLVLASIGFIEARRQANNARAETSRTLRAWALLTNAEFKGKSKGAESMARDALAICEELFPADHQEVCDSLHILAYVLFQTKPDEAIALEREAVARHRRRLGNVRENLGLAWSLDNLGNLLLRKGAVAEAESLYRETLPLWRKYMGDDHITVANTLDHLAGLAGKRGNHAEAETFMSECLAIRRHALGNTNAATIRTVNSLIDVLKNEGKHADAEKLRRDADAWIAAAADTPTTKVTAK